MYFLIPNFICEDTACTNPDCKHYHCTTLNCCTALHCIDHDLNVYQPVKRIVKVGKYCQQSFRIEIIMIVPHYIQNGKYNVKSVKHIEGNQQIIEANLILKRRISQITFWLKLAINPTFFKRTNIESEFPMIPKPPNTNIKPPKKIYRNKNSNLIKLICPPNKSENDWNWSSWLTTAMYSFGL